MNKKLIGFIILCFCTQSLYSGAWVVIPSNKWDMDNFIASYDSNKFVICGQYTDLTVNRIYVKKTTDYGNTWKDILVYSRQHNDTKYLPCNWFTHVAFPDSNTIYVLGRDFFFAKTYDGGENWDTSRIYIGKKYDKIITDSPFWHMKFLDKKIGFFIHPMIDSLIYTLDGGSTFITKKFPYAGVEPYGAFYIDIRNINDITVVLYKIDGDWKKIVRTRDLGDTWEELDESLDLCRIYRRKSENEIWAAGFTKEFKQIPFIKKSLDNGVTWDTLFYPTYYQDAASGVPQGLFFYDDPNKIAFPTFSYLYRTVDAGKTWTCDTIPSSSVYDIPYWDRGMISNKGGKLYRLENGTSVKENSLEIPILLYPNPLPRSVPLNINFRNIGNYSKCSMKIVDITGKTVDEFNTNNIRADMNFQYLPDGDILSGTYFLVIESDEGIIAKEKFVLE
ncbi:MAG: T9SS type A sorting domain-containing protein [bacterium]